MEFCFNVVEQYFSIVCREEQYADIKPEIY